ncbi:MAG TPA: OmpA family protein, partial [Acidimicrobiales bacterium]|nr:OmpA family protein [Acidimicrobiales bacterium]
SSINSKKFLALALGLKSTFDPKPGILPSGSGLLQEASLTKTVGSQYDQKIPTMAPLEPGVTTTTTTTTTAAVGPPSSGALKGELPLSTIQQQVKEALAAQGLSATASTSMQTRGLVVTVLDDEVFFATDSASIGPIGISVINTIAGVLRNDTNNIVVEGYTDNQPIYGGPFTSNLELSAVRAVNVAQELTMSDGIDPGRVAAMGYGQTHPVAPNDTPAHQAENRRIDVVVLAPGVTGS